MNIIGVAEGAALHVVGDAVAGFVKAQGHGDNIITELEQFALALVTGAPAKISYKLPTEQVKTTFQWEGKTWDFVAEVVDGKLEISATPQ